MVSEGKGQVWGKDDPMQLSDIIPKKSMYDKMRPPKVEGIFAVLCIKSRVGHGYFRTYLIGKVG